MIKDKNPKIENAKVLEAYKVEVRLKNFGLVIIDLEEHLRRFKVFAKLLANPRSFADMYLDEWGWFIAWSDETEISADVLHRLYLYQTEMAMRPEDFEAWMNKWGFPLHVAAAQLGISRRMVAYYKNGEKIIPRTILLATIGWEANATQAEDKAKKNLQGMKGAILQHGDPNAPTKTKGEAIHMGRLLATFHTQPGTGFTVLPTKNGKWEVLTVDAD